MTDIYFLKVSSLQLFNSYWSMRTRPCSGSYILNNKCKIVVFPKPEGPTIAFVLPGSIFKVKSLNK